MKKLFEIPIYAFNRKVLYKREEKVRQEVWNGHEGCPKENINAVAAAATYPACLWDYNHIVGFIRISVDTRDIMFDVFVPTPQRQRYLWWSKRKIFLYNSPVSGAHFHVNEKMTNESVQKRTAEMLQGVIKTHVRKRYFVDTEAFYNLNEQIDYLKITRREQPDAQTEI